MKVLISGASGLIGSALVRSLQAGGHHPLCLVRGGTPAGSDQVAWDPATGRLDRSALEGVDAVVNLAGESVAQGRWTRAKKARILDSRVRATRLLATTAAACTVRPRVFLSASAVGFYGDRGEEVLDERSTSGSGFLAEVCRQWELAAGPAAEAGIRTVLLRVGMVVSRHGGALAAMLPLFRLGLGGPLGSGRQFISWITLPDLVRVIDFVLTHEDVQGPVNAVTPQPVSNRQWTAALGRVLYRPAILPVPPLALRLAVGEMANAMLLASTRAVPRRLQQAGFTFQDTELDAALRRTLNEG